MKLAAIILCGGTSRRMGLDKAMLPFGDEALLGRVVRLVGEAMPADRIICVAAAGQPLPDLPGAVRVERDRHADRGPLEGLATGLAALAGSADAAFVTTCDAPLLVPRLVLHLGSLLGNRDAVIPAIGAQLYPLTAIYNTGTLDGLNAFLDQGGRRVIDFAQALDARIIPADELRHVDRELWSLRNCNTLEEYEALRELGEQA